MHRGNSDLSQRVKKKVTLCYSLESGMKNNSVGYIDEKNQSTGVCPPTIRIQTTPSPKPCQDRYNSTEFDDSRSVTNSCDLYSDTTSVSINTETDLCEESEEDPTIIEETSFVSSPVHHFENNFPSASADRQRSIEPKVGDNEVKVEPDINTNASVSNFQ